MATAVPIHLDARRDEPSRFSPTAKSKGGRPRHGEFCKTSPLSIRVEQALRDAVQAAAEAEGRTLTQQVEHFIKLGLGTEPQPSPLDERIRRIVRQELAAQAA